MNRYEDYRLEEEITEEESGKENPYHYSKKRRKGKRTFLKKAGALVLSAIVFGGLAGSTMVAVNRLAPVKMKSNVGTAKSQDLLKTASNLKDGEKTLTDVSAIVQKSMPFIVSITNKSVKEVEDYYSLFRQGQKIKKETQSAGSGIIIGKNDKELLIVTNYHVIESADTLSVSFVDEKTYEASVKGTDSENDLAVIAVSLDKISEDTQSKISVASLVTDEKSIVVGEPVVAIGNALGYGQSVTTGIVSATNRSIVSGDASEEEGNKGGESSVATYIQTDAAINPGNSGGALLNSKGQVIGINSVKLASTEIEGIGYAIPISRVYEIIEKLMVQTTKTKVEEGKAGSLGIMGLSVTDEIEKAYSIPKGVYVSQVLDGGAAKEAGISEHSVITGFDGNSVKSIKELQELLQYYEAGSQVKVTYQVPNGDSYKEKEVTVTLKSSKESQGEEKKENEQLSPQSAMENSFPFSYGGYR